MKKLKHTTTETRSDINYTEQQNVGIGISYDSDNDFYYDSENHLVFCSEN